MKLKLDSLTIAGFKSFVDPVEVRFAGGITAIVGPNGCGKSNLSDAIVWVLGEQSVKMLRGAKMEDIIFSGSDKRKPVGMAEVSLSFATDSGYQHAVEGKITISRRVFREGGSQYRLNGRRVRLKEIKDLLMDTGLGIRAYSVIEQGKIGMILSGKPQERRKLLEEAAGITKYKERKRVAEVKLEEATANLMRLDDIVSEVERALRSLKRQAGAARRYQQKEGEYRDLLKRVLLGRWSRLRRRLGQLDGELDDLIDRDARLAARLSQGEADLATGRERLDELSRELAERHQQHADLAATIEGRQEFLKGARQRLGEMGERLVKGRDEAEQRRQQTADFRLSLDNLDGRTKELIAERDDAAQRVAQDDAKISAAQKNVEQTSARLEGLRRELLESVARVNQLRSNLQRKQVEIEKRSYRQRFLDEERTRLERQLQEAEGTVAAIDERVAASQNNLTESEERHRQLEETLESLLRREAELSDERRDLESRLAGLGQRRRILEQLAAEHAERRAALIEKLRAIGIDEPRFLADIATPTEGWEDGIDHFLGELADAVVLEPGQSGLELARALSAVDTSGIFLEPIDQAPRDEVEDEALSWSLAEALDLPPELAAALPPAYLVQRADDAARLARQHPGIAFISRDHLWAQGGASWAQGKEAAPGVLARQSELEEIREEIPRLEGRLARTRETLQNLVTERTRIASERNKLGDSLAELRRDIAVAQARRQDASTRRDRFRGEHEKVAGEQAEITRELEVERASRAQMGDQLAEAEAAHTGLTETFDRSQAEVEAAKEEREALRTAGAGNRGRLDLLEERLESHNQEASRVRRQITFSEEQLEIWSTEGSTLERRMAELESSIGEAETALQGALDHRTEAQERVLEQQRLLDAHRESLRRLEESVQEVRGERDTLRQSIEGRRVDRAGLGQDAEHLAVSYREAFKRLLPGAPRHDLPEVAPPSEDDEMAMGPEVETGERSDIAPEEAVVMATDPSAAEGDGGDGEATPATADDDPDGDDDLASATPFVWVEDEVAIPEDMSASELAGLEGELAGVKEAVERLGPVNVLAAEEFDEQEERHEFLTTQRRDVAESVESLKLTILEINETSSERFRQTFDDVNRTFGQTFQRLFRGGEAEMRLFDEDDLLDTGIEIVARPPGKRPQNIMLLSGGEKALTAIALLFALFQTKPSPFCILDEVDAPLDDANVLRFVETLEEMAKDTQFLVVTHNKLTMEIASTLYGVTMEERGVSKLVAVEMDDVQPPNAAVSA